MAPRSPAKPTKQGTSKVVVDPDYVFDPKMWWLCEQCGHAHEGHNPPDDCDYCGHRYFENYADCRPHSTAKLEA